MDISVIIPTFNHGKFVGEAVASALHQTHPIREVIVVDDGSTDDTSAQVARLGSRVRYIYKSNGGLSSARNTGMQSAQWPWIAFLDSDDWWLPEKISRQVEELSKRPGAVLAYTSATMVLPDGSQRTETATPADRIWPTLRHRNCICGSGSAVLVSKDVLMAAGGFDENLTACEDWDLWVRLAQRHRFVEVREALTCIRLLPGSMSSNPSRMLTNTERILEPTLLSGLSGLRRHYWRRRIRAAAYYRAATACQNDSPEQSSYVMRSLTQWPFPDIRPERWICAARLGLGKSKYESLARLWRMSASSAEHPDLNRR